MPESTQNTFNISDSSVVNAAGSGDIYYNATPQKQTESEQPKKTILFLAANPLSTNQLRLDEEIREIGAGLQRSKHRDHFELKQQWAMRPRDLQRAMLDNQPQIVHFSGHGVGQATNEKPAEGTRKITVVGSSQPLEEGLILEDVTGQPKLVSTEALASLFALFKESVECVILNACYSKRQAEAIAQHIPYVIGMNQAIGDRTAIEFAVGFYDALGAGEPFQRAYQAGCLAIQMAGILEHLAPILLVGEPA